METAVRLGSDSLSNDAILSWSRMVGVLGLIGVTGRS